MKNKGLLIGCAAIAIVIGLIIPLAGGVIAIAFYAKNNLDWDPTGGENSTASTACGISADTLVPGFQMLPSKEGKLGFEDHLTKVWPFHYKGKDSTPLTFAGAGAFAPHMTEQEHWYINSQWGGWDWEPTLKRRPPLLDYQRGAAEARKLIQHAKLIITSVETKKSIVVSAEESGPALWVTARDGVNFGAPPEVYKYLGVSSPYTKNPTDDKGKVEVSFAQDQNAKLGPCL